MSGGANQTTLLHHLGNTCKTIDMLTQELDLNRRQISDAASALVRRGYVERVETGCFQLTGNGLIAAQSHEQITSGPNGAISVTRKTGANTLRQRAWNVMRIQRRFTIPDLLTAAATGEEALAANNLQRYCRQLCRAGILRKLPKRQRGSALTSNGYTQFTLVQDLGHLAPVYRGKTKAVFDHNSGKEMAL
ncbi:hypothetical protein [Ruegeria arenilitoris]|uniref:hypothetical protein n=1 Tax=Ruegeria arenilitoris TaxID=1173585 RepID=UPI00147A4832|nr:hypothetical protein [Ruegeria arenilitoris]